MLPPNLIGPALNTQIQSNTMMMTTMTSPYLPLLYTVCINPNNLDPRIHKRKVVPYRMNQAACPSQVLSIIT